MLVNNRGNCYRMSNDLRGVTIVCAADELIKLRTWDTIWTKLWPNGTGRMSPNRETDDEAVDVVIMLVVEEEAFGEMPAFCCCWGLLDGEAVSSLCFSS